MAGQSQSPCGNLARTSTLPYWIDFLPRVLMRPLMTGLITVPTCSDDIAVHAFPPPLLDEPDDVEFVGVVELVELVPPPTPLPNPVVVPFPVPPVSVVFVAVAVPFPLPLPKPPLPVSCLFRKLGSTNAPWSLIPTTKLSTNKPFDPLAGLTVARCASIQRVRRSVQHSAIPTRDRVAGQCRHDVQLPVRNVDVVR